MDGDKALELAWAMVESEFNVRCGSVIEEMVTWGQLMCWR